MNQSEKESEQNIGGTNQNHLQQSNTATESAADSSTNRNQNSVISGQPAISSPYIHLSTCYAGKVTYLLNKSEPSGKILIMPSYHLVVVKKFRMYFRYLQHQRLRNQMLL